MGIEKKQILVNPSQEDILINISGKSNFEKVKNLLKPKDRYNVREIMLEIVGRGLEPYIGGGIINGVYDSGQIRDYSDIDILCTGERRDLLEKFMSSIYQASKEKNIAGFNTSPFEVKYLGKDKNYFGMKIEERFKLTSKSLLDKLLRTTPIDLTFVDKQTFDKNLK